MSDIHSGFQEQRQIPSSEALFRFLDAADTMPQIQRAKQMMRDVLMPQAGSEMLDIGSGVGHEVERLAQMIGPTGRVVGIDVNPLMVAEAARRADTRGLSVAYQHADAQALPFADSSFDGSRAERVLMYVADPAKAITEMVRVVRSGGRVVVFDFDYGSMLFDAPDENLARQMQAVLASSVPNGTVGRRLTRYFRNAGLVDVTVQPYPIQVPFAMYQRVVEGTLTSANARGEVSDAALAAWITAMAEAEARGDFFAMFMAMIVTGRKP